MSDIQRWSAETFTKDGATRPYIMKHPAGQYVSYDDHLAAMQSGGTPNDIQRWYAPRRVIGRRLHIPMKASLTGDFISYDDHVAALSKAHTA